MDPGVGFTSFHYCYTSCLNLDVHKGSAVHCSAGLKLEAMQMLPSGYYSLVYVFVLNTN